MEEKEIELIDYIKVIKKRWLLIIGGTALCAALSLLWALLLVKPNYSCQGIIKVGQVANNSLEDLTVVVNDIDSRPLLIKVLQETISKQNAAKLASWDEEKLAKIVQASPVVSRTESGKDYLIRVGVDWPDAQEARAIILAVGQELFTRHRELFSKKLASYQSYRQGLALNISSLSREIELMKAGLRQLEKNTELKAPEIILLQANVEGRERALQDRQRELRDLDLSLLPPATEETRFLAEPVAPLRPNKAGRSKTVIMAALGGLLAFTLLAFSLEYLEANKERLK